METQEPTSFTEEREKGTNKSKKKDTNYVRMPLFTPRETKPVERGSNFLFGREFSKEENSDKQNKDAILQTSSQDKEVAKEDEEIATKVTEDEAFDELPELPSADEILARIQQETAEDLSDTKSKAPTEAVLIDTHETSSPMVAELPLEEGEVELPLNAVDAQDLHERLQTRLQAAHNHAEEHTKAESTKEDSPVVPETQSGIGGGGEKPPVPPSGGSETGEPVPGPEPEQQKTTEVPIYRSAQEAIARQFGKEVPLQQGSSAETSLSPETRTVPASTEGLGVLSALAVGLIDWRGRHKIRHELRTGHVQQSKRLKETQKALHNMQERQYQQKALQERVVERLQASVDYVTTRMRSLERREQAAPERLHRTVTPIERQSTLPIEAMAAAAAARHQAKDPERSHIEASAWHRYEVDNKTGRVVEHPSFAYGREFKREQSREVYREHTPAATAGQLALTAIGTSGMAGGAHNSTISPQDGRVQTTKREPDVVLPIVGTVQKSWLWTGLVVVVFIIASSLILV